jgi:sugar lactone lactonase YvrE
MPAELKGLIRGPVNAEDLVVLAGTRWVVASGMRGPSSGHGRLYPLDVVEGTCHELFPARASYTLDEARFGPLVELDPIHFEPHGLDATVRPDGVGEVYVVNHGWRESIEVFEVDLDGAVPSLTWIGGATMPAGTVGNDVAAVPGGGFLTGDRTGGLAENRSKIASGEATGKVVEWSADDGWQEIPGNDISSSNGVAVSADGAWAYVAGWASRRIKKVARSGGPRARVVAADFMVDNLTWTRSGHLLAAGVYDTTMDQFLDAYLGGTPDVRFPSRVVRVDPDTLEMVVVVEYGPEIFGAATTGLEVGDEIWVGTARGHGIARFVPM